MWRVIVGFGIGVYVGTYYDCKPSIKYIRKLVKDNCPNPRPSDGSDSNSSDSSSNNN